YNIFQIFTRNPRVWRVTPLNPLEVERFRKKVKRYGIHPLFAHMPYLPNLASSRDSVYSRSMESLTIELERCIKLGIPYLVTHLGSHLGAGKAFGRRRIIGAINDSFSKIKGEVILCLENTAGTRNSMGSSFEDIKKVVDGIIYSDRIGVCFDTCHAFAAGYDLRTEQAVNTVIEKFEEVLGWERLKVVHLNGSKGELNGHKDRHEHIGLGKIGMDGFRNILHSRFREIPLILETPLDEEKQNLENLKKVRELMR
ncbi:deoxyribonuclease IV, partial [Candidatus Bathyarchaeota archaeon]|nr:deoxyribonuclease IV [Candidatus Bathyarchaeota archaeon]